MGMKIFDLETLLFRLNMFAIIVVVTLLAPTTTIVASWYPRAKEKLWWIAGGILLTSCILWILMRFSIPLLIKLGVFEDRRKDPSRQRMPVMEKVWRIFLPALTLAFEMSVLIFMCICILDFMQGETWHKLLIHLD